MIEKIIKLQGVGLLHDPLPSGAVALLKTVAVYSDNGRGKSTLAAVLRAAAAGELEELSARTTLGGTKEAACELLIDGSVCEYDGTAWTKSTDSLLVFDAAFIERNVHAASSVGAEQRRGLLDFALGDEDVVLTRAIDARAKQASGLDAPIRALRKQIQAQAGTLSVDEFIALPLEAPTDEAMKVAKQAVNDAVNQERLSQRAVPLLLELPDLAFDELESTLGMSVESLRKEAEEVVLEHVRDHLGSYGAEAWLEKGVGYLDDVCPFCGRPSEGIALLGAYRDYFNEAYTRLKVRVVSEAASWDEILKDAVVDALGTTVADNSKTALAWADHADIAFPEAPDVVDVCHRVRAAAARAFQRKAAAVLDRHALPQELQETRAEWDDLVVQVGEYNRLAADVKRKLSSLQTAAAQADVNTLRGVLARLEAQRHRGGLQSECDDYSEKTGQKSRLAEERRQLQEDLSCSSEAFLRTYGEAVNNRLQSFQAGFRLADFARSYAGDGVARAAYGLVVHGHPVPLTAKRGHADFATTLSDGDKRLLALALFLARLDVDAGTEKLVVVFDDPICSFDIYRRETAAQVIAELTPSLGQVIVLSHDPELIHLLDQRGFEQTLQIRAAGNGCVLQDCDIGEVCRDPYVAHYSVLTAFASMGAPAEQLPSVAESIRPYLEANLRHRFPLELAKCRNLGEISRRIRECQEDNPLAALKQELDELQTVNDFAAAPHHAEPDADRVDERQLQAMVGKALEIGWN